jgi:hypothetical protein
MKRSMYRSSRLWASTDGYPFGAVLFFGEGRGRKSVWGCYATRGYGPRKGAGRTMHSSMIGKIEKAPVERRGKTGELDALRLLCVPVGLLDLPDHARVHRAPCSFSGAVAPCRVTPPHGLPAAPLPEKQNSTERITVRCWPKGGSIGTLTASSVRTSSIRHRRLLGGSTAEEVLERECTNGLRRMPVAQSAGDPRGGT